MIKLIDISKRFEINKNSEVILKNINLDINEGDIFGLVGKTGSGKSTLLRIMNGFIEPDYGSVYLFNEKLDKNNRQTIVKDTSMIFQSFNLLNNLTVLENVLLPIRIRKKKRDDYLSKASELLNFVGLSNHENSYIKNLSGGEKQRVAIARALITDPKVIFCDEPTSALDDNVSYEVLNLLKQINKNFNTTIVIVSHDISVIKSLCNNVAIIEDGSILDIIPIKNNDLKPLSYKEALLND